MNRETVIHIALQAGLLPNFEVYEEDLERFAELIAAFEREACANSAWDIVQYEINADLADKVVQAIQSRSKL